MTTEIQRTIGELEGILNIQLFSYAMTGAALRNIKALQHKHVGVAAVGGNELKVQTLLQLVERLETLIRAGKNIDAALDAMRHEGWLIRMDNFEMMEQGK